MIIMKGILLAVFLFVMYLITRKNKPIFEINVVYWYNNYYRISYRLFSNDEFRVLKQYNIPNNELFDHQFNSIIEANEFASQFINRESFINYLNEEKNKVIQPYSYKTK